MEVEDWKEYSCKQDMDEIEHPIVPPPDEVERGGSYKYERNSAYQTGNNVQILDALVNEVRSNEEVEIKACMKHEEKRHDTSKNLMAYV